MPGLLRLAFLPVLVNGILPLFPWLPAGDADPNSSFAAFLQRFLEQ